MDDELADVYNELIMEHSMNSYNKKQLKDADYSEIGHNPNSYASKSKVCSFSMAYNGRYFRKKTKSKLKILALFF